MVIKYGNKKITLFRCPCCDDEPTIHISKMRRRLFRISCENDNCIMVQTLYRSNLEQAAREWNRRPWSQVPDGGVQDA